jgi:methionine synthase II (cobalamin-independent)
MSDYDPRTDTGIPTEPVGSLPRPSSLQKAYAEYDAGNISKDDLEQEQDAACKDSIERGEATGAPIISDGEQWWSSFATYPVTDTLAGTGLADHLGPGGQYFAIFADGHYRQLPKLVGGPFRYKTFAADTLKRSIKLASRPMKQAVIAPSMLALLYPLDEEISGYSREQFESDLVDECEKDIRGAFDAGAVRVSIDFTEGRLALREDSRNPWTGRGMLPHFVALINGVLDRFTPEERANIGVHTCPGGDRDSVHSADVPYSALLPSLFELNAGYFMMQCRSERDRESVYKLVGEHSRDDANGVPQVVFVGVINPQNPRVESAQEVCDELVAAAKHIPTERLGATDDCGFSPFSIDEKPLHGSADYARDIAFQKIENRVQGTKMAAEKLGVHVPAPA